MIRVERETERSEWQRKIDEKEAELIGLRDEVRRKRSIQGQLLKRIIEVEI